MISLIDANELVSKWEVEKALMKERGVEYCDTAWEEVYDSFIEDVKKAPQVSPIQAIHYYWQERDREYGERMDDIWKNM